MAFTGTPVINQISDRMFRVTGVSLAADASGTIGLVGKTSPAEVSLNAPSWAAYHAAGGPVSLQSAVSVIVNPVTDVTAGVPISIVKTGVNHLDFLITVHNDTAGTVSGLLEFYVEFH